LKIATVNKYIKNAKGITYKQTTINNGTVVIPETKSSATSEIKLIDVTSTS
jgi:hypothetical protein